eukprot:scaffold2636_cov176-Ochromonas_danica.AAC.19
MANQKEIDDLFGSDDEDKVEDGDEGGSTPPPPSSSSPAQGQDDDNKDDNKDDDDINGARVRSDEVDKIFADDEDSDEENAINVNRKQKKSSSLSSTAAPTTTTREDLKEVFGDDSDEDDDDDNNNNNDPSRASQGNGDGQRDSQLDDILGPSTSEADLLSTNTPTATTTKNIALFPATRLPEKNKTIFFRTPNFVKIQSQEFRYEKHASDQERKQFDGATAVIRWKRVQQEGGGSRLASNARLLKWSDGSYQLVVGNAVFQAKLHPAENWWVTDKYD